MLRALVLVLLLATGGEGFHTFAPLLGGSHLRSARAHVSVSVARPGRISPAGIRMLLPGAFGGRSQLSEARAGVWGWATSRGRPGILAKPEGTVEWATVEKVSTTADPELLALAGTPAVVNALREKYLRERAITASDLAASFSFPLDEFQMGALTALVEKRNVIVSAPTGSGKTVCGEAAVYLGSALGKRVLYTTPLKALSNQKYNDFCAQFGAERVGLLTGDVSINREAASILVVTTEVYRNMLYDIDRGSVADVHAVVLDEFHYMNDRDRGTVWEESVIHTPRDTLIIALSATMRNCKDIRDWFEAVQGPTDLITSDFRPVPLLFKYADRTGIANLFDKLPNKRGQPRLNRMLMPGALEEENNGRRGNDDRGKGERGTFSKGQAGRVGNDDRGGKERSLRVMPNGKQREGGKGRTNRSGDGPSEQRDRPGRRGEGKSSGGGSGSRGAALQEVPSYGFVVRQLKKRDMLPAIFFIFSRVGCDQAAEAAAMEKEPLVTDAEKAELRRRLTIFATTHREVASEDRIRLALRGIASHHAGLMPLWKSIVEELFQDNLIKVVFATETLAAGINMPARTTVITSLSKRTNEGIQSLTANELRQMCGRAGRRGKDTVGHSVIMKSRWEGAPEGFTLVTLPADPLVSKFSPNYGMVLNLLEQRPIAECKQIVERSFGSFMAQKKKGIVAEEEVNNEDELDEAVTLLQKVDVDELKQLAKQVERLKSEERVLKFLQLQAAKNSQAVFEDTMPYAAPGTSILLRPVIDPDAGESTGPESAVLIDFAIAASDSPLAFFATLTQGNKLRIVTHQDVVEMALDADLVSIALPASPDDKEGDTMAERLMAKVPPRRNWLKDGPEAFIIDGDVDTFMVAARIPKVATPPAAPEVEAQRKRVEFVRNAVESSPIYRLPERNALLKALRTATQARTKRVPRKQAKAMAVAPVKSGVDGADATAWREFEACAHCLEDFGMIKDANVTSIGRLVGAINADNALWMGVTLLYSDELQALGPHELAAAICCLVAESSRADVFVGFEISPKVQEFVDMSLDMQARLLSVQLSHGVEASIPLDTTYAGLVEAWALGASWAQVVAMTSMQEGDIIRILRRVLDALRQIPRLPFVPGEMGVGAEFRVNARRALTLMDRFPVSDDVTYTVDEAETLDEALADNLKVEMASKLAEKTQGNSAFKAERMGWAADDVPALRDQGGEGDALIAALVGDGGAVEGVTADWFEASFEEDTDEVVDNEASGDEDEDDEDQGLFEDPGPGGFEGKFDALENEFSQEEAVVDAVKKTKRRGSRKVGPKGKSNENQDDEDWIKSLGLGKMPESLPGDM